MDIAYTGNSRHVGNYIGCRAVTGRKEGSWAPVCKDYGPNIWVRWKCRECGYIRKGGPEEGCEMPEAAFCENCGYRMEERKWSKRFEKNRFQNSG